MRPSYFSFGNVAIDDLVFADGSTKWSVPGGGAVYAALGMSLWTGAAAVLAPLGSEYPRATFPSLDFSQSRSLAHTMRNWGLYETDGSRHFLSRRDSLPWAAFSSNAGDLDNGPYPHCHIAPMPWRAVVELVEALLARGARAISLDLHDRELAAVAFEEIMMLLERVHVFLPSRQDVDVLFPGREPAAALGALRRRLPNVRVLGVKCGSDGVLVHAAGSGDVLAVPPVHSSAIDATGAGDAFCGGFLAGFAEHGDALDAALRGAVSASFAVAAVGPAALADADRDEAQARLVSLVPRVERRALAGS